MKTFTLFLTALILTALFAAGCINEDPTYRKNQGDKPEDGNFTGTLALNKMEMRVVFEVQSDDTGGETTRPKASSATRTEPDVTGYIVEIFDAKGVSVKKTTYGELKKLTEPLTLPVGAYTLEARSQDQIPDSGWDTPIYVGRENFTVTKNKLTELSKLVCTLSNIKVTLVISADLAAKLSADTQTTISLGTKSETFTKTETRAAYFMPEAPLNTLEFHMAGKFVATGSDVRLNKTISGVKAGQWRKITLVISYIDKGNVKFDIKVDNFTLDEEVVVDGTEDLGMWEPEYNEIDPTRPTMTWTGNDFDTPIQLTADMFDEDGICSEPFELKLTAPNGVETFFVTINTNNPEFAGALNELGMSSPFDLCALQSSDQLYSLLKGFMFPVGDEVKGKTSKTFYIGGTLPSLLYEFAGTHSFSFDVMDANGLSVEKTLTIVVDKANEGPSIVWEGHDLNERYNIEQGMKIGLTMKARSGIKALQVTINGSLEPALVFAEIPQSFDLCNLDADLAAKLKELGFPVGAEIKDKTEVPFTISTELVSMMAEFPGDHDFVLRVTASNNAVTEKTLQLHAQASK